MRNMKLVASVTNRRPLAVALYPSSFGGWDHVDPREAAKPGQIATYMARSQLPIKAEKIFVPDGALVLDVIIGEWRKSIDQRPMPIIPISEPVYITVSVGEKNEPPMICGTYADLDNQWNADTILPFAEVKEVPPVEATIPAMSQLVLTRMIDFDFVPKRFVLTEGDPTDIVVNDIKIGKNSSIAASGQFPLKYLASDRAPRMAINANKPVPRTIHLSVSLTNTGKDARTIAMAVLGEGIPSANAVGVTVIERQED